MIESNLYITTHFIACINCFPDGYTTDDIMIRWANESSVTFSPSLTRKNGLPEFRISGNATGDCTAVYATGRVGRYVLFAYVFELSFAL